MPKETYPQPGVTPGRPRLAYANPNPEYGATREQWEERVFRQASHYNVVRFKALGGSDIATVKSFPLALYLAHKEGGERKLIYVVTEQGEAFCMSPKDYDKFAQLYLENQSA